MLKNFKLLFIFLIAFIVFSYCGNKKNNSEEKKAQKTQEQTVQKQKESNFRFSGLTMKTLDGNIVKFEDVAKGKIIIFDLWDTWCPPCKAEIPDFIQLYNQYKDKGFLMIGIALGRNGDKAVQDFVAQKGITYPIYIANKKEELKKYFYDARGIPTTYIIDGEQMKILEIAVGYRPKSFFEKFITNAIGIDEQK